MSDTNDTAAKPTRTRRTRGRGKGAAKIPTPITNRLFFWLDDRVGTSGFAQAALRKAFPDHWSFLLGEVALYSFLMLLATGIFLTFYFTPAETREIYHGPYVPLQGTEVSAAFGSVMRLSFEVKAGLVLRQIHHWAALLFLASIVAHCMRVFFTGAFRKPRDINWVIGVTLLILGMFAGFTGYSLPDDLLSGTGLRIGVGALMSVPVVGVWASYLIFGGEYPAPQMIGRLYSIHILMIPAAIVGLLVLHLAIMWRQKHSQHRGAGRTEDNVVGTPMFPNFAFKSLGLAFCTWATIAFLGGWFQINPIWLYGQYRTYDVASPAQPDWYMGWLEGSLRLWPNWEFTIFGYVIPEPFIPALVIPGIFFTTLLLWPWIERRITKDHAMHNLLDRPRDVPWRTAVGAGALAWVSILTLGGSNDVLSVYFGVNIDVLTWALRFGMIIVPLIAGFITYRICAGLKRAEVHPIAARTRTRIVRTADGGFAEEEVPVGIGETHREQIGG